MVTKKKNKILIVEDEEAIANMYKLKLQEEGFEVILTNRGSEAIELATKEQPVVILLDIIMPEMDGFSVLQELKAQEELKKIPVFMLTNLGQEADFVKGKKLGAENYFIKSQHTPTQIITEIKNFLNK
jgi:DNA-binding response OmpR family regulator